MSKEGRVDFVLGLQRGDEGKGRIVDYLAPDYDIVARFNGGSNAGHTIVLPDGRKLATHQMPSGIAYPGKLNLIGNGALLDPLKLIEEVAAIEEFGFEVSEDTLVISDGAVLTFPHQILRDVARESGTARQGSTKAGIPFTAADKYERIAGHAELLTSNDGHGILAQLVFEGLERALPRRFESSYQRERDAWGWVEQASQLAPFVQDTVVLLNDRLDHGAKVLAEGAQAFWLDVEHGMKPLTTSSHTTIGGGLNGLGVPPHRIGNILGVAKAFKSHVGNGPFVTEIHGDLADTLRGTDDEMDVERGATTGRDRRMGYLDLPELRRAVMVNGIDNMMLTKLDRLGRFGDKMMVAVAYDYHGERLEDAPSSARKLRDCQPIYEEIELWDRDIGDITRFKDLPASAQHFIRFVEEGVGVDIKYIGVGYERDKLIEKD